MKKHYLIILLVTFLSCRNEHVQQPVQSADTYYKKGISYAESGKADSAYLAFEKAKEEYIQAGDSLGVASCLIRSSFLLSEQGDHFGAQETSLQTFSYLDTNNTEHWPHLAFNYNTLANATSLLKDFEKAIHFSDRAIQFSTDSVTLLRCLNNKAATLFDSRQYNAALDIFQQITFQTPQGTVDYARALTNLAKTKWRTDSSYDAGTDLKKALQIRQAHEDRWGQNSSYAHLTEYYEPRDKTKALLYAQKRYAIALQLHSADDQLNGLRKLIKLSPANQVQPYFDRYQTLQDSVQQARAAAKNQFAVIRYEVDKNKAENLMLQKDNAVQAKNIVLQRSAIIAALALIIGGVFYYKKRKQRLKLEAQDQIKASKLKTSRRVHDVVANGIYLVMAEIENKTEVDRDGILDRLEVMYNKSRNISYEAEEDYEALTQPYYEELSESIRSYATDTRRVITVGNDAETWQDVNPRMKEEIRHVLLECMVNMKKHSRADNVVVKFMRSSGHLAITYRDNGVGVNDATILGNGMQSMVSRINSLGGHIIFDSIKEKGLEIKIDIPIV